MATTATLLLEGIVNAREVNGLGFQENEVRRSRYGTIEGFNASTPQAIPASTIESLRESATRTVSIDVFQKEAIGTGTARACSGTGGPTTANVDLTWATFSEEFALSTLEYAGNRVSEQEAFNHLLAERMRSLYQRINAAGNTFLDATAVATGGTFGATVANATQILAADRLSYFNQMKTNLEENDFFGPYANIHSFSQSELVRFDQAQGGANATNLQFQLSDYIHYASQGVSNGVGVESTSYMYQPGTIGMVTWINRLERIGDSTGDTTWGSFADPLLGQIGILTKESCTDNSGTYTGAEADKVTSYVLAVDVAFLSAYDSTTTNSGIYKGEVLA